MSNSLENLFRLDHRLAVVTGAGGQLGPQWVAALLSAGAMVAAVDLPGVPLSPFLLQLAKKFPKHFHRYDGDVTDSEMMSAAAKAIHQTQGAVTILVNNAGIDVPPTRDHRSEKEMQEKQNAIWQVNVQGVVTSIETFLPDMKKAQRGSIITIGSLYATRSPYAGLYDHLHFDKPWVYGSTKAAVGQLTRHFATRLAPAGIRVNMLSPGGVLGRQDKEFISKYSQRVPMGRLADAATDLAGPLIFLASDASAYITGINLDVTGGYTAW